jgi:hypothetical protein
MAAFPKEITIPVNVQYLDDALQKAGLLKTTLEKIIELQKQIIQPVSEEKNPFYVTAPLFDDEGNRIVPV